MSHRVTTETDIKNKALALQACKTAGITAVEAGADTLRFTSGKLANATLDLRSGRITGDTDYGHTHEALGSLRQAYGEATYRQELLKQGASVESRTVETVSGINNVIRLRCSTG
jgi:hypothetical protein